MAYLERVGSKNDAQIELSRKETTFGRDPECEVVVDKYKDVSRQHCGFTRYEDGVVTVTDFGSRNGTRVNGKQVYAETRLNHRDHIKICDGVEFVFIDPDSPEGKNEARIKAKEEERAKRRITVEGDNVASEAMTEVSEQLQDHDFHSLMSEIIDKARPQPKAGSTKREAPPKPSSQKPKPTTDNNDADNTS